MDLTSNLMEYAEPGIYDCENQEFSPDGPFFLALAQRVGGSALELGCGTGRVTIPMARAGIEMTGLDLVEGMLALAKAKAGSLPITWVQADVRDFHLGRRFDLIFEPGAPFAHMLTIEDQRAFLARVREHLSPRGIFAVSLMFPNLPMQTNIYEVEDWFSYQNAKGQEVKVTGTQTYDPLTQVRTETAIRTWVDAEGQEQVRVAPLSLRNTFPQEMEGLLACAGFTVLERYGDWDSRPLTRDSKMMIYVCRANVEEDHQV